MNRFYILLSMLFLHIVDDFYLQGILAKMKQKKWWNDYAPSQLYKYDYIVALIIHSFSWSFMIMLPLAFETNFNVDIGFIIAFVINLFIHAIIDDLKANKFKINLIVDQFIHVCQIVTTFIFITN